MSTCADKSDTDGESARRLGAARVMTPLQMPFPGCCFRAEVEIGPVHSCSSHCRNTSGQRLVGPAEPPIAAVSPKGANSLGPAGPRPSKRQLFAGGTGKDGISRGDCRASFVVPPMTPTVASNRPHRDRPEEARLQTVTHCSEPEGSALTTPRSSPQKPIFRPPPPIWRISSKSPR